MTAIKNVKLIDDFINGHVYDFNYDLLMNNFIIRVKLVNYYNRHNENVRRIRIYEIKLRLMIQIEHSVFEKVFEKDALTAFNISEGKYKEIYEDKQGSIEHLYEENVYNLNIKLENNELNLKCKNIVIDLIFDKEI